MIISYIKGIVKNICNPAASILAIINHTSKIDKLAKINRFARIVNSEIGAYSYVGVNSWVIETRIGKFCSIANNVQIGLAKHTLDFLSTSPIFTERSNGTGHCWVEKDIVNPTSPTEIGNDVWIGYGALICCGIKIGDGAVVGAGAVVTKDIPPYAIVGGVPAHIIRYRYDEDTINSLEEIKWWNFEKSILKNNILLFQGKCGKEELHKLKEVKKRGGVK